MDNYMYRCQSSRSRKDVILNLSLRGLEYLVRVPVPELDTYYREGDAEIWLASH